MMTEGGDKVLFTTIQIIVAEGVEAWRVIHLCEVGEFVAYDVFTQF